MAGKLTSLARQILRRTGFDLVRWQRGLGRDPIQDMKLLVERDRPVLFDVGGNEGQTVLRFRESFPLATIHVFEPGEAPFQRLREKWRHDRLVQPFNVAVGSEAGTLTLKKNSSSVMSSLLELGERGWGNVIGEQNVPVITLDQHASEANIAHVEVLKSDTQGFDLEVLKGANTLLSSGRVDLVYVELITTDLYRGLPRVDETISYLLDRDYRIVSLYEQFYQSNMLAWTDVLFGHKSLFDRVRNINSPSDPC